LKETTETQRLKDHRHVILQQTIQNLLDRNQEILLKLDNLTESKDDTKQIHHPYVINTRIIAKQRMDVCSESLNELELLTKQFNELEKTNASKNKIKMKMEKNLDGIVRDILGSIQFGSTIDELLAQSDNELKILKEKLNV